LCEGGASAEDRCRWYKYDENRSLRLTGSGGADSPMDFRSGHPARQISAEELSTVAFTRW